MFKNRPAIILFSPAMGRKGEMSRVIHQGEFIDYNFFKTVITLMARFETFVYDFLYTWLRKIPWNQEPGRLQSMGSLRVRHD